MHRAGKNSPRIWDAKFSKIWNPLRVNIMPQDEIKFTPQSVYRCIKTIKELYHITSRLCMQDIYENMKEFRDSTWVTSPSVTILKPRGLDSELLRVGAEDWAPSMCTARRRPLTNKAEETSLSCSSDKSTLIQLYLYKAVKGVNLSAATELGLWWHGTRRGYRIEGEATEGLLEEESAHYGWCFWVIILAKFDEFYN